MAIFADIRKQLFKKGLLEGDKKENLCVGTKAKNYSGCGMCGVTEICSEKNALTGLTKNTFKTPAKNKPQYNLGAGVEKGGLRYRKCNVFQTCLMDNWLNIYQYYQYIGSEYGKATTKQEFCNLTHASFNTNLNDPLKLLA